MFMTESTKINEQSSNPRTTTPCHQQCSADADSKESVQEQNWFPKDIGQFEGLLYNYRKKIMVHSVKNWL